MRSRKKKWAEGFILDNSNLTFDKNKIQNTNLTLEVGIGKGDFICQNALDNKDYLHIGCELDTSIYAIAMKKIVSLNIDNVKMLNCKACDLLNYIEKETISKIYLNFSDPWPQNGYRKRRLVHPIHLEVFENLVKDGGEIAFKTDNLRLFEMAVKNFFKRNYKITFLSYDYQTINHDYISEYESKFRSLGQPIYRIVGVVNKKDLHPWDGLDK